MATTSTTTSTIVAMRPGTSSTSKLPILLNHHSKTIDAGRGGHTLSCGPLGDILQLNCYHPVHGMIVACPFAQFDGNRFHDPEYVRSYRKRLLDYVRSGTRGFGLRFEGEVSNLNIGFIDDQWIKITYSIGDIRFSTRLSISKDGEVTQSIVVSSDSLKSEELDYTLSLGLSVNRASYGQLTEGGPLPIPQSRNETRIFHSGYQWAIINENLDAIVDGTLYCSGRPVCVGTQVLEEVAIGKPASGRFTGRVRLLPGNSYTLTATFNLRPGTALPSISPCLTFYPPCSKGDWKLESSERSIIIRRNLEYILGSCTLPVGDDAVCFITDHVALPLGWNRDNYWQIRFLLDVYQNLDTIAYPETARAYATQIRSSVKGHLTWVFHKAERPHGYWHRSYLANGIPKDGPVFQQDQQCYPVLELCDFFNQFPEEYAFVEKILRDETVDLILHMLEDHRDPTTGLYTTEETPGDDAVEHPFHFSSHVLLWHTVRSLSALYKSFPKITKVNTEQLDKLAEKIKVATLQHFVGQHPQTKEILFAYLTDGAGQRTFYHDANDIPTLFALDWDFIDTPKLEAIWNRTMDFGLSPLNEGGFYPEGEFGGLGSVHTRGPWPLGYAQEFIYANLTGDALSREDAWRRIQGSMFWDGLFPEAVDSNTGDCVSKAWFSWPGSMIGSALLRFSLKQALKSLNSSSL